MDRFCCCRAHNEGGEPTPRQDSALRTTSQPAGGVKLRRVLPVPKRHVQFHQHVIVYILPFEDRRSPWMAAVADRHRFQRRIKHCENILRRVLLRKHIDQLCGRFAAIDLTDS